MKTFITLPATAVLVLAAAFSPAAQASEITVAGYTNGCFGACSPPDFSGIQTASILGLTYQNSTFNQGSSGGFIALGTNGTTPGTQNFNNFGSFTLTATPGTYTGQNFSLLATFTLPTVINGSNTTTYNALLTGSVTDANNGGILLDFDNTPLVFTFSNASASGSFNLIVQDAFLTPGKTVGFSAFISGAQQSAVPEPATLAVVGAGLLGLVGLRRRFAK